MYEMTAGGGGEKESGWRLEPEALRDSAQASCFLQAGCACAQPGNWPVYPSAGTQQHPGAAAVHTCHRDGAALLARHDAGRHVLGRRHA